MLLYPALSGEQLSTVIHNYIDAVQSTGVKVRALVLDAHASNVSACQKLGCEFSPDDQLKTSFFVNGDEIFVFFDVCHTLKLMRNLVSDFDLKSDAGIIKWKHFEKLNEVQNAEGLHLANKLTTRCIHYRNEKMKVSLAARTLSKCVLHLFFILKSQYFILYF